MGQAIERIAMQRGHTISQKISLETQDDNWEEILGKSDVAIEFTSPEAAVDNILSCFRQKVPVVCGTTGWYKSLPEIVQKCTDMEGALFYASNFSLGVNLFFELNKTLASLMNGQAYKASMEEIHHTRKKDAPSGTAITLAEGIISNNSQYQAWKNEAVSPDGTLPILSVRTDDVPGTHIVRYRSEVDELEIRHTAFNRDGFALGAVIAAEFLAGKKGIFTISDLLKLNTLHGN